MERKRKREHCVIHMSGIKHGSFTYFSDLTNPNDRLALLKNIRDRRLAEPPGSSYRMTDICQGIPDEIQENEGYHRGCYQRFTLNLHRLTASKPSNDPEAPGPSTSQEGRVKHKKASEKIIFEPDCIFCNTEGRIHVKKAGIDTKEGTSSFERDGWQKVLQIAEENNHEWLLRRIRGFDLFAAEAQYHPKCRKQYTANYQKLVTNDQEPNPNDYFSNLPHF